MVKSVDLDQTTPDPGYLLPRFIYYNFLSLCFISGYRTWYTVMFLSFRTDKS